MSATVTPAATALVNALAALAQARREIEAALHCVGAEGYEPPTRQSAAVRTTGTQVLYVLSSAAEPLALPDIADGVCALRRGEDEPKARGGTRYQEMCRTALARLIERGLVVRVEPTTKRGLMRFARVSEVTKGLSQ
jgi:hypothetical protein